MSFSHVNSILPGFDIRSLYAGNTHKRSTARIVSTRIDAHLPRDEVSHCASQLNLGALLRCSELPSTTRASDADSYLIDM